MKNVIFRISKIFGVEWFLLLVPIAYLDATAAMLCIMFIGPIVVVAFAVINYLIYRLKHRLVASKIFLVLRIISVILALILFGLLSIEVFQAKSPEGRFESLIMNPVPSSVTNLKQKGNLYAMGSSSLHLSFDISPTDLEAVLTSRRFSKFVKNDPDNVTGRAPKLYKASLNDAKRIIADVSEMYVYEHTNSRYRYEILIVNKEHNKVYFGMR